MSWRSWSVVCAAFFTLGCSVVFDTSELLSGGSGAAGGQRGTAGAAGGLGDTGAGAAGAAGGEGGNGAAGAGGEGGGMDPCGAGLTLCSGGQCVDTSSDSEHCGACGHECGGGQCVSGVCQAVELASFPAMHGLLLDEASDRVFFTTSNFGQGTNVVGAVPKVGGEFEFVSEGQPASSYLALTGSGLYWTTWDQPSVLRVEITQPRAVPTVELALSGPGYAIQVINEEVFYADYNVGLFSFSPLSEPAVPVLRVGQFGIRHFLFDEASPSFVFTVAQSSLKRYLFNTNTLEDFTIASDPWDIVQDANFYYFSDQEEGTLRRITKLAAGDEPTELMANGFAGARGLALDDDYVYVVGSSAVARVAKAPPFESTVVASAATGNQIAVDEQFIYWTNFSSGKLMKIAKPL